MALRPILKLAKRNPEYKGKCKLENDCLIIKGNKYTTDTLNRLPIDLAPYKCAQHTSETHTIFHGHHTPLSNFHSSPFTLEGQEFKSAEQYIQYKKSCHFNDYNTAEKILNSKDPYEAKTLSRNIPNFDRDAWRAVARDASYPGIRAKFEQNPLLMKFLNSTKPMKLAESSFDKLWGTGLALYDENALNLGHRANEGLLGSILMEIRENNPTNDKK